jgi:hypothetical protein
MKNIGVKHTAVCDREAKLVPIDRLERRRREYHDIGSQKNCEIKNVSKI